MATIKERLEDGVLEGQALTDEGPRSFTTMEVAAISQAISLKRIADAQEKLAACVGTGESYGRVFKFIRNGDVNAR